MNRKLNVSLKVIALALSLSVPTIYADNSHGPVKALDKHEISAAQSAYKDLEKQVGDTAADTKVDEITLSKANLDVLKDLAHQSGALLSHYESDICSKDDSKEALKSLIDSCMVSTDGDGLASVFPTAKDAVAKIDKGKLEGCRYWLVRALEKRSKVEKGFADLVKKGMGILLADSKEFKTSDHKDKDLISKSGGALGAMALASTLGAGQNFCPLDGKKESASEIRTRLRRAEEEEASTDEDSDKADKAADKKKKLAEEAEKLKDKPTTKVDGAVKTGPTDSGGSTGGAGGGNTAPGVGAGAGVPTPVFGGAGSFDPSALQGSNGADLASLLPLLQNNNDRPTVVTPPASNSRTESPQPAQQAPQAAQIPPSPQNNGPQGPDPSQMGGPQQPPPGGMPPGFNPFAQNQQPQNNTQQQIDDVKRQYAQDASNKEFQSKLLEATKSNTESVDAAAKNAARQEVANMTSQMGPGGYQGQQQNMSQIQPMASQDTVAGMLGLGGGNSMGRAVPRNAFAQGNATMNRSMNRGSSNSNFRGTGQVNFSSGMRGAPEGNIR